MTMYVTCTYMYTYMLKYTHTLHELTDSPEEVGSVHVHTKNISREPIGYNTKIDTEGITGAH